jgi:hypothetical protein
VAGRTFVVGEVRGHIEAPESVPGRFPTLDRRDGLVFLLGDVDRGPHSAEVVDRVRRLRRESPA